MESRCGAADFVGDLQSRGRRHIACAEGIEVSERDMIPLCLTDRSGTPTLGLYRGIKLIADQNDRQVEMVDPQLAKLLDDNDWPVYVSGPASLWRRRSSLRRPMGLDPGHGTFGCCARSYERRWHHHWRPVGRFGAMERGRSENTLAR